MAINWNNVLAPVLEREKLEQQIAETNKQTQAILDGIKANQQAQLEGQVAQANNSAQGQQTARTLIAGALAEEDDTGLYQGTMAGSSFGQLRAKKRATLLEGL